MYINVHINYSEFSYFDGVGVDLRYHMIMIYKSFSINYESNGSLSWWEGDSIICLSFVCLNLPRCKLGYSVAKHLFSSKEKNTFMERLTCSPLQTAHFTKQGAVDITVLLPAVVCRTHHIYKQIVQINIPRGILWYLDACLILKK